MKNRMQGKKRMRGLRRLIALIAMAACLAASFAGCGSAGLKVGSGKRIIRIAHSQSETHPEHIGLLAFKEYIEENLGDKYEVQIFPNELLGDQKKAIELTQTGAIDFVVVGTPNIETVADIYEIFSMPYLFSSKEAYFATMNDTEYIRENVFNATDDAGFEVLTWYNAGLRSFYATKEINTPEDMKGLKIRVQQSPASIAMVKAFGAAATPMSFGEVYTAIQQGVIDGAENNELALTNNKHGEVAKYYSRTNHQMIPDVLVGNLKFLQGLSDEEKEIFQAAADLSTEVELKEWDKQVEEATEYAINEQGVTFIDVDMDLFREKVLPLHEEMLEEMLEENESIRDFYDHIQEINAQYSGSEE